MRFNVDRMTIERAYDFGETRVGALALLTFTALSG
jgi:hypothetical protein